jgi:hypothetical protein
MTQRVVCGTCQDVLQDGPVPGTKWVTCTKCIIAKNPGADPNRIFGADGRVVKSGEQRQKDLKSAVLLENLEETLKGKTVPLKLETEFVMYDGKIILNFLIKIKGFGKFDYGLSLEQLKTFVSEMEEIKERAEKQKELRDNLNEQEQVAREQAAENLKIIEN